MINTASIPAVAISLWVLAAFSAVTWALIIIKGIQQFRFGRSNRRYSKVFWASANLQVASEIKSDPSALARLAIAGLDALRPSGPGAGEQDLEHSWDRHELLERNLRQQIHRERRALESGLAVLATVGSTSPFVGLFGTVWGIMESFRRIGVMKSASLAVVAPGIAEALIATAAGLAAAIPAVIFYNYFLGRINVISTEMDNFSSELINIIERIYWQKR